MFKLFFNAIPACLILSFTVTAEPAEFDLNAQSQAECCIGRVGDVNMSGDDEPTLGDAVDLWMFLLDDTRELPCLTEADIDGSGGSDPTVDDITIQDVGALINYLFIDPWETRSLNPCIAGGAQ